MPSRRTPRAALADAAATTDDARRALLADWCRLVGKRLGAGVAGDAVDMDRAVAPVEPPAATTPADPIAALNLPPRVGQTLARLLAGRSEKQIALDLGVSPHTVHTYVKALHRRFNVSSRGELLALFVTGSPLRDPGARLTPGAAR